MSFLPARYFQVDRFLSESEHQVLMDWVCERESQFEASKTSTGKPQYRVSKVLYEQPELVNELIERVQHIVIPTLPILNLPPMQIGSVERQITAHNDGGYYKVHNDNGSKETGDRIVSYCIYFHTERFTGGELRIYDLLFNKGYYKQAKSLSTLRPRNNSLVLFPSHFHHEVLPVVCPSKMFCDSRFTLNGWIRRA